MNARLSLLIVLLLVGIILLPTANGKAQATRIDFTGVEQCDENTLDQVRLWMAASNLLVRGWTETCAETASIPQMTGTIYLYDGLANIGKNYIVNVKFRMETDEGGVWVGTAQLTARSDVIQVIGNGQGSYEGLELHCFIDFSQGDPKPFTGYILDTGR